MAQPIVMTVTTPAQPRQAVLVTGTGFGFVDGAFFVDPVTAGNTIAASYVQVADGQHCLVTVPPNIVTNTDYVVELLTVHNEVSTNAAGLIHIDPIGSSPLPPAPTPTPDPFPLPAPGVSLGTDRLRKRIRLELGDPTQPFQSTVVGDGATARYDLPARHLATTGLTVRRIPAADQETSVTLVAGTDYIVNTFEGIITLTAALADGDVLVVSGDHYRFFDDDTLDIFVETALAQVGHNRTITTVSVNQYGYRQYLETPLTANLLPEVEIMPVAILAKIEALWVLATNASYDIDISEDGASIPRSERYRQIMGQIQAETARWNELAEQLNIGLGRIEMQTLRRVSRLNNRLVPVYVEKEYDDMSLPIRVLPGIDHGEGEGSEFIDPNYVSGGSPGGGFGP